MAVVINWVRRVASRPGSGRPRGARMAVGYRSVRPHLGPDDDDSVQINGITLIQPE